MDQNLPTDEVEGRLGMRQVLATAERDGKAVRSTYDPDIVLTPAELRAEWATGRLRWSACNWVLIDPRELFKGKLESLEKAKAELARFAARFGIHYAPGARPVAANRAARQAMFDRIIEYDTGGDERLAEQLVDKLCADLEPLL